MPDGAIAPPRPDADGQGSFALAAEALVDELVTSARPGRHGPTWSGRAVAARGDGRVLAGGALGDDVYGGRAGIAWVVARTARGRELAREVLHGAVEHAMSRGRPIRDVGLFSGATGIAVVAVDVGRRLDDGLLEARGRQLATAVARTVTAALPGDAGFLHGRAGVIVGLLTALGPADAEGLGAARTLGDVLVGDVATVQRCGLAHGASGVGLALDRLGSATGDDRYQAAAASAVRYERACFSPAHGWPDQRTGGRVGSVTYPASWCQGAAGIGLARLAVLDSERDPAVRAEVNAAAGFARSAAMATLSAPDPIVDSSLCHGLAGAIELFLGVWEATGAPEHLAAARRTGGLMMARARAAGRYGSGLFDRSPTLGLFLGTAGVAATLLRLADPASLPSPARLAWSGGPAGQR